MASLSLLDHFSALEDPRQSWKVVYPLPAVLVIVLCGTMVGAGDFVEIERWARRKLDFLRRILPFARGIPSHDTLNDVMNALPAGLFAEAFTAWVEGLREIAPDLRRHRRQDLAAGPGRRRASAAPRLGLGEPPAPGSRSGSGGGEGQRDHRHPAPAGAAGARGGRDCGGGPDRRGGAGGNGRAEGSRGQAPSSSCRSARSSSISFPATS